MLTHRVNETTAQYVQRLNALTHAQRRLQRRTLGVFMNDFESLGRRFGSGEITLPKFVIQFKALMRYWK